jgi:hypothetical protein
MNRIETELKMNWPGTPVYDPKEGSVKIVSTNESPTHQDGDGCIRAELTDIGKIIDRIDEAEGRNDALKAYIYALRDLQRANELSCFDCNDAEIERAQVNVAREFDRLIVAEFKLNRADS